MGLEFLMYIDKKIKYLGNIDGYDDFNNDNEIEFFKYKRMRPHLLFYTYQTPVYKDIYYLENILFTNKYQKFNDFYLNEINDCKQIINNKDIIEPIEQKVSSNLLKMYLIYLKLNNKAEAREYIKKVLFNKKKRIMFKTTSPNKPVEYSLDEFINTIIK